MIFVEELGILFKNDPTFDFVFNKLPKSLFRKVCDLRRKRLVENTSQLDELLQN